MDLRELFGSDAPSADVTALAYDNRAVAPGRRSSACAG